MRIEARLRELGLVPPPPIRPPQGVRLPFRPVRVVGDRAYISGHGPQGPDGSILGPFGKVGAEVTVEQGYQAARSIALSMLGSLSRYPASLAILAFALVAITFSAAAYLSRMPGWTRETAFFAALPGALSLTLTLAATHGADLRLLQGLEVETAGQSFLRRLEASIDRLLEFFASQRPYYLLMLEAEGLPQIFQRMMKSSLTAGRYPPGCGGPFAPIYEHLNRLMGEGIREGALRDEDPSTLAAFLMGITKGMGFTDLLDPREPDVRERKPMIVRFFLRGASPT